MSNEQFEIVIKLSNTQNKSSYYASCQQYVNIVENYNRLCKNLHYHQSNIDIISYHEKIAKLLPKKLMVKINDAFKINNFPVLDMLPNFDPCYLRKSIEETVAKDVSIVNNWYRINKVDVYHSLRKESATLTGCARETFLNEFKSYSTSIKIKKI